MTLAIAVGLLISALFSLILLFLVSFVAWMAVDAAKQDKFWWIVFILGLPPIGATVYFFVEKEHDYMKIPEGEEAK